MGLVQASIDIVAEHSYVASPDLARWQLVKWTASRDCSTSPISRHPFWSFSTASAEHDWSEWSSSSCALPAAARCAAASST
eukprot:scaffold26872_cov85-Isochrysis_galbana.AAC.2